MTSLVIYDEASDPSAFISPADTMRLLGISRQALHKREKNHQLRKTKFNGRVYYRLPDVVELLDQRINNANRKGEND